MQITQLPSKTKNGTIATVGELKPQLNIPLDFDDDDAYLQTLLDTAVEQVESDTNSDVLDTANILTLKLAKLPGELKSVPTLLQICQAPARTVSKIEYLNNGWQDVAANDFGYDITFNTVEIQLRNALQAEQLRITFTTGYTDAKRPKRLKQATILKAADFYDVERSNYAAGVSIFDLKTYSNLLKKHVRTYF